MQLGPTHFWLRQREEVRRSDGKEDDDGSDLVNQDTTPTNALKHFFDCLEEMYGVRINIR
ncbi:hypothetical protein E1B28_003208 [Marasmius oreades]|uniref:Uncharacterized protein n=1 Tax=Marasmius oreades TaxID=181124 RepID=A0A9P7RML7_9AGAR|nr:uncharacterized protein E1B28_003208 [Marasmius oreades]KAG7085663.1 hypothetical protein E1B28_003208 [Marasmius oreades]